MEDNKFLKVPTGNWTIPDTWDFEKFPLDLSENQMQALIITIWKQYILHDEIMLGLKFLENAPYIVRNTSDTLKAINATKGMLAWLDSPSLSQKHNAPENPTVEVGAILPHPLNGQQGARFDSIVRFLEPTTPDNPKSILDFGCFDGAFTNRYAMLGYKVTGIDLVKTSIDLANRKAREFNTGAVHIESYFQDVANKIPHGTIDCATSTESYEHLRNPVEDMFLPAKKVLKPTGKFLVSTPHGAHFRGKYVPWAHPWIWDEKEWLGPNPRAHLIAPDVWTLASHFREAGFWVKNSFVIPSSFPEVDGQGNVFGEALMTAPGSYPGLNIVFFVGNTGKECSPFTLTNASAEESVATSIANNLASQGNKVSLYTSCGRWGEGIYNGIEYYQTEKYQNLDCDILFISKNGLSVDSSTIKAKVKLII
jgi:2-polyprenyl-3-methyl-5-hydroxy-6-metoxy-1,4-benzoquinol methylase